MEQKNTVLTRHDKAKGICVLLSALLIIIILANLIPVWKNPVKSTIKKDATAIYHREELALPDDFKSILIDPNNMIWLGWSEKNGEDYYCLYGSTEFTHSPASSFSKNYGTVTMNVELVFTEDEWLNERLAGYATFYSSEYNFYDPVSHYRVYVSVYNEVIRSSGIGSMNHMGDVVSDFSHLSEMFMREMLVSFDNFLHENDFKDFHND